MLAKVTVASAALAISEKKGKGEETALPCES